MTRPPPSRTTASISQPGRKTSWRISSEPEDPQSRFTRHPRKTRKSHPPRDWAQDAERRAEAGVPEDAAFATKPAMVRPVHFFAYAREGTALAELAAAAGSRWAIEDCFAAARDDLGLDHCEARSWHGWHRHMSLVMAAQAFLARRVTAALAKLPTAPELRTLIAKPMLPPARTHPASVRAWSRWRSDHQATAAASHRMTRRKA